MKERFLVTGMTPLPSSICTGPRLKLLTFQEKMQSTRD